MKPGVKGIERIIWRVRADNFEKCVTDLARVMNIEFSKPVIRDDLGVKAAVCWDAGVEVVAPLNDDSEWGALVAKRGEGLHMVVFSVDSLDQAVANVEANGFAIRGRAEGVTGDSHVVKEAILRPVFGGQIVFAETEE